MNCAERDHYLPPSRRPPDQRSTVEAEKAPRTVGIYA
jgi:hypothetical protein